MFAPSGTVISPPSLCLLPFALHLSLESVRWWRLASQPTVCLRVCPGGNFAPGAAIVHMQMATYDCIVV